MDLQTSKKLPQRCYLRFLRLQIVKTVNRKTANIESCLYLVLDLCWSKKVVELSGGHCVLGRNLSCFIKTQMKNERICQQYFTLF